MHAERQSRTVRRGLSSQPGRIHRVSLDPSCYAKLHQPHGRWMDPRDHYGPRFCRYARVPLLRLHRCYADTNVTEDGLLPCTAGAHTTGPESRLYSHREQVGSPRIFGAFPVGRGGGLLRSLISLLIVGNAPKWWDGPCNLPG